MRFHCFKGEPGGVKKSKAGEGFSGEEAPWSVNFTQTWTKLNKKKQKPRRNTPHLLLDWRPILLHVAARKLEVRLGKIVHEAGAAGALPPKVLLLVCFLDTDSRVIQDVSSCRKGPNCNRS